MDTDALRRELSALDGLLHSLPDTAKVGSPYVEEYGRAIDRVAELGIDVDAFRLRPGADGADAEGPVERAHMLTQIASLVSYVRLVLKRKTRSGSARCPRHPRGDALN